MLSNQLGRIFIVGVSAIFFVCTTLLLSFVKYAVGSLAFSLTHYEKLDITVVVVVEKAFVKYKQEVADDEFN